MLQSLSALNWLYIDSAHGRAEAFPRALRDLCSDSAAVRNAARDALAGAVCDHCGTVSEAAVYAVPFLVELLRDPHVIDKAAIFDLLLHYRSPQVFPWFTREVMELSTAGREVGQDRQEMAGLLEQAIEQGLAAYLALLSRGDLPTRLRALRLIAGLHSLGREIEPHLVALLQTENNAGLRAALVEALGRLNGVGHTPLFWRLFRMAPQPGVRFMAALCLARQMKATTPPAVQEVLLANLPAIEDGVGDDLREVQHGEGLVAQVGLVAALWFDAGRVAETLLRLMETLESAEAGSQPDELVETLLAMAFRDTGFWAPPFAQITPLQYRAAGILARSTCVNSLSIAARYGLTADRQEFTPYLTGMDHGRCGGESRRRQCQAGEREAASGGVEACLEQ